MGLAGLALAGSGSRGLAAAAVESVRLTARVAPETGAARVEIRYVLAPTGRSVVPVRALGIGGAGISNLAVLEAGVEIPVALAEKRHGLFEASIDRAAGAESEARTELRLVYTVDRAVKPERAGWRVALPVAAVPWRSVGAAEENFVGVVEIVGGGTAYRSFPTRFEKLEGTEQATTTYRTTLPVAPAALCFSVAPKAPPRLTVERAADASLMVVLAGLAALGWNRFRKLLE